METPIIPLAPLNERIFTVILEQCQDVVYVMPEFEAYIDLNNLVHEKAVELGLFDQDTLYNIENLVSQSAWLVGTEMFKMGLAIGRTPGVILDLPNSPFKR